MKDNKIFLNSIVTKMVILSSGSIALTTLNAIAQPVSIPPGNSSASSDPALNAGRQIPAKLILKQQSSGFKLIAQHDSHSSHDSHASHDSHSSHASSAHGL